MWRADPHTHSVRSDGIKTWEEQAILAKNARLGLYGRTDHDVWAQEHTPSDDTSYLRGVEVSSREGHVLVYAPTGIKPVEFKIATPMTEVVKQANGEGLVVGLAHLGFFLPPGSASVQEARRITDKGMHIDFIEAGHPMLSARNLRKAGAIASEIGAAVTGSSDDHLGNIGRSFTTVFPRETDDPEKDFFSAIAARTTRVIEPEGKNPEASVSPVVRLRRVFFSLFNDKSAIKITNGHKFLGAFAKGAMERAVWEIGEGRTYGK